MFKIFCIIVLSAIVIEAHTPLEKFLRQYFTNTATPTASSGGGGLSGGSGSPSSGGGSLAGAMQVLSPFGMMMPFGMGPTESKHKLCYDRCRAQGNFDCACHDMCRGCDMTCGPAPAGKQAPANALPSTTTTSTTAAPTYDPAICLARCNREKNVLCDRVCGGCTMTC